MTRGEAPETISYVDAMDRLHQIVDEIESAAIDVDDLAVVVKEAVGLIALCRAKLSGTQSAVEQALSGLRGDVNAAEADDFE